ncbi:MAG: helix-turn-helix domain-containing protein [Casimicrobiaceae bacterium]
MIQVEVGDSLADVEKRLIEHTLQSCRTREEAARILGISTKTLYNKLRLYESAAVADVGHAYLSRVEAGSLNGRPNH